MGIPHSPSYLNVPAAHPVAEVAVGIEGVCAVGVVVVSFGGSCVVVVVAETHTFPLLSHLCPEVHA